MPSKCYWKFKKIIINQDLSELDRTTIVTECGEEVLVEKLNKLYGEDIIKRTPTTCVFCSADVERGY
ncbi:MAG: hypothetical protein GYA35_09345 [Thermoanaerobaculaceae bacterium]|nr:hypothetical protein [Thermoanaerobaculaceae bacterium]